ncbi:MULTISPECIES: DUF1097 domain-containing protein [Phycicoccus]|uniref:DUF1097 domain-containing protein n=1 Tax=Phycicoccus TaxID=367298 RepID=UPI00068BE959|nr:MULTISPECIES: DUF1097 domain-containing protein [Phycicoccus]GIL36589.1 hypothetical protein PDTK01_26640 [Phycicoccus sp. DTK01]
MKSYIGVAVSIGVLAGIWTQVSVELGLVTWIAFVVWAGFYAAGGNRDGFVRILASALSGVVYGWLAVWFAGVATFPGALAVAVAVIAAAMCLQAGWFVLSFIPGAFFGAASYFGNGASFWSTVVAVVVGAVLGWASAVAGARIQALVDGRSGAARPPAAEPPAAPAAL